MFDNCLISYLSSYSVDRVMSKVACVYLGLVFKGDMSCIYQFLDLFRVRDAKTLETLPNLKLRWTRRDPLTGP